jgi:mono/diheme cytochrome c family protein
MPPLPPLGALVALAALSALARGQSEPDRARTLFVANCASCHGETGDGKGTSQLDRPARSFQDGGFSFGNTPEALFKTISTGIPGSPMAGFDSSLTEEERRLLASYVVTLGPPVEEVKEEDMILAVHDRPVVVRGLLPALGEGLSTHPRGLLIGDPSGITFEYRVDDVRLLALRQGGFVKRSDWSGRGGTPLEPLGKVVHLVEGGKPEATFFRGTTPLVARLSGTLLEGQGAGIEFHLTEAGRELAHVREIPSVLTTAFGTGYSRVFGLRGTAGVELAARSPAFDGATVLASGARGHEHWQVVRGPDGPATFVLLGVRGSAKESRVTERGQIETTLALRPGVADSALVLMVLVLVDWNEDVRAQLERWYEAI